ncbi:MULTISPECIES: hypothetical protein [unclassified Chelatococcus]|uniref:hypothetical protein n=1 Tax=unclassified Chelatococcus TaxID=2638111 RepID=UPI001BCAC0B5|nr:MULTISPECIES: hypothetical protein [unclassified Chelatococcus]MBS7699145.1 hypothetical protein [Chelatococcus sp. YT9]MBX3554926.1 hypothetical protein [Chelatococcus sp.]
MTAFPEPVHQEVRRQISRQLVERSFVEVTKVVEAIVQRFPEHAAHRDELRPFVVKVGAAKGAPIKF